MAQNTATGFDKRWEQISIIWRDNRILFAIAGWFVGIVTPTLLYRFDIDFYSLFFDILPEAIGILFTVFILDNLAANRHREHLQERLIREAKSRSQDVALAAIDWMRESRWIQGEKGIMQGIMVEEAKWSGANLDEANLENAVIDGSDLTKVKFYKANLRNASLLETDFTGASLSNINFDNAWLARAKFDEVEYANGFARKTDFKEASMTNAALWGNDFTDSNFKGVNFTNSYLAMSNFTNANLVNAKVENSTWHFFQDGVLYTAILPDGIYYDPYNGLQQLNRFTDPEHPDLWQPEWVKAGKWWHKFFGFELTP